MHFSAMILTRSKRALPRQKPWLIAVAFALLVQSLFPSGYMPGNLSDGWFATLCPEGMPVAFMRKLMGEQQRMGEKAGHHPVLGSAHGSAHGGAHDHVVAATDDGHGQHNAASGDCQLGSALDQPLDVYVVASVAEVLLADLTVPTITLLYVDRQVVTHTRSRAPPTA